MRLIDADLLIKELKKEEDEYKAKIFENENDDPFSDGVLSALFSVSKIINSHPTCNNPFPCKVGGSENNLNEAIEHARKVAKEKYAEGMLCHANPSDDKLDSCIECAKEHEQLADWLKELKQRNLVKGENATMDRKETTKFLSKLLISNQFDGRGKYWASEVSIDYGTSNVKRVDFMQFEPEGVIYQSDIEKGIFTCYEVKSCREDVFSGNGLNFIGEKNYIVTTMECYKAIRPDIRSGKLLEHIKECCPEASANFGILVPVP